MDELDLKAMVEGFKMKRTGKTFKSEVIAGFRRLGITRAELLKLSLQDVCRLTSALISEESVQQLSKNDETISLREILAPAPRKERSDKGVPRKKYSEQPDADTHDGVDFVNDDTPDDGTGYEEQVA